MDEMPREIWARRYALKPGGIWWTAPTDETNYKLFIRADRDAALRKGLVDEIREDTKYCPTTIGTVSVNRKILARVLAYLSQPEGQ
jgi:hypothetical protein